MCLLEFASSLEASLSTPLQSQRLNATVKIPHLLPSHQANQTLLTPTCPFCRMKTDGAKPYCFWHPDTPSEKTLRRLVKEYPNMAYLVGRACAVAGYDELYHELGLLPEVSIAEEAREQSAISNNPGSKAIFKHIMKQSVCYAVLDDYTRTISHENPQCPAFMNGDTAVLSTLDVTVGRRTTGLNGPTAHVGEIITAASYSAAQQETMPPEYVELFYTPLPLHLPTIIKDPLIIMAGYEGNLDRYLRLRRPGMIMGEHGAPRDGHSDYTNSGNIRAATLARFIMANDLSNMTATDPDPEENYDEMPGMIWWPLIPAERTLEALAKLRPDMHLQVAMTCIAGNYTELWDKLAPEPSIQLWDMASWERDDSVQNHFVDYLRNRASEFGLEVPGDLPEVCDYPAHDWCWDAAKIRKEPDDRHGPNPMGWLPREITMHQTDDRPDIENIYGAWQQANVAGWELHIASTEEMRAKIPDGESGMWVSDEIDGQARPPTRDTTDTDFLEGSSQAADDDDNDDDDDDVETSS
ncbi:hypothetical protein B0T13DRAFT_447524 [Neurospora crassa]|nr:hypothetical protein B0T13DRAFT_447524 [Neurospora crassa]